MIYLDIKTKHSNTWLVIKQTAHYNKGSKAQCNSMYCNAFSNDDSMACMTAMGWTVVADRDDANIAAAAIVLHCYKVLMPSSYCASNPTTAHSATIVPKCIYYL